MLHQLSLFSGKQLKEMGQKKVLEGSIDWLEVIMKIIQEFKLGEEFTSEELKFVAKTRNVKQPKHHNSWGACINAAAKTCLIRKTGSYVKSTLPEAHARMLAVWERI